MLKESWKLIENFPNYQISTLGRVHRTGGGFLSPRTPNPRKYRHVYLYNDGMRKRFRIARLMLLTFRPRSDSNNLTTNHIDGNIQNDRLDNLEWSTMTEQMQHARDNGLQPAMKLDRKKAAEIKHYLRSGTLTYRQMSERYGVSRSAIKDIKLGRTWADV